MAYTHSTSMMSFARGVGESRIRRLAGWTGLVILGVLQFGHPADAQGTSSAASARAAVEKALRGGRYDEVETLGKASTDQAITVMRAQALIARGEYASAEPLLTPLAAAGPNGDAALELGLLQMYLGRRSEARRTLQLLLMGDPREANAREFARAARAARGARTLRRRQSFLSRSHRHRPQRRRHQYRLGRSVSREAQSRRCREVVSGRAQDRARLRAGADRHGPCARRRESSSGDEASCAALWN